MSPFARRLAGIVAGGLLLPVAAVLTGDQSLAYFVCLVLVWALFAIGFDLAFGVTGLLSFGHAAFFGGGAYVLALTMLRLDLPFWLALGLAGLGGGLLALLFGLVVLRQRGIYLGLTTLALGQLVSIVAEVKLRDLTGGTDGLAGVPRPEIGGLDLYDNDAFAIFLACIFTLGFVLIALLRASPFGRVLRAIRQDETRVAQLGYAVRAHKLAAFGISGVYAGVAGGLLASLLLFVGPELTRWTVSGDVVIMSVLGGRGTLWGPVVGVLAFEWLREFASRYTEHWYGVVGLVFILVTLFLPQGLIGGLRALLRRRGRGEAA